jgi:putative peptidoglycan lipid II flippase
VGVFSEEIVSIFLERGAFGVESRETVGAVLTIYSLWLVPAVLSSVLGRVHYAMLRWRPVMYGTVAALVVKLLLSYWFIGSWGVTGLAAATAAASASTACVLLLTLPKEHVGERWRRWILGAATLVVIFLIGAALGHGLTRAFPDLHWLVISYVRTLAGAMSGLILLFCVGPRLDLDEALRIRQWVAEHLLRRR